MFNYQKQRFTYFANLKNNITIPKIIKSIEFELLTY